MEFKNYPEVWTRVDLDPAGDGEGSPGMEYKDMGRSMDATRYQGLDVDGSPGPVLPHGYLVFVLGNARSIMPTCSWRWDRHRPAEYTQGMEVLSRYPLDGSMAAPYERRMCTQ